MFGSHRYCGNGYTMILVCHVISQDHMVIWTYDFTGGAPHGKLHPSQVWWQ